MEKSHLRQYSTEWRHRKSIAEPSPYIRFIMDLQALEGIFKRSKILTFSTATIRNSFFGQWQSIREVLISMCHVACFWVLECVLVAIVMHMQRLAP
jgi:hypothetical protein